MKKRIGNLILLAGLVSSMNLPIMARDLDPIIGSVTYTANQEMDQNDPDAKLSVGEINAMQPGDTAKIVMNVNNEYAKPTDWYMSNEVISSLQSADGENNLGGGYQYRLTYVSPSGESRVLYESVALGGEEGSAGLEDAASGLENFVFLDTLSKGETGVLTLEVVLDGETQGNHYQEKAAEVAFQFAAESVETPEPIKEKDKIVKTKKTKKVTRKVNTSTMVNRLPWLLMSGISGVILLILAFFGLKEKKEKEDK